MNEHKLWTIVKRDAEHIYDLCEQILSKKELNSYDYDKLMVYRQYFLLYSHLFFDLIKIEGKDDIFINMFNKICNIEIDRVKKDAKEETE